MRSDSGSVGPAARSGMEDWVYKGALEELKRVPPEVWMPSAAMLGRHCLLSGGAGAGPSGGYIAASLRSRGLG